MPDNLIGKKMGDYILRRKLATGGMSHIYIGEDEKLGRKAAIKILTPDMQRGDRVLSERFEREARAIAALEHDSIIPIYQFGEYEDMYFLAMRYIEGMDMADEIQHQRAQGKMLDVHRAIYILEQVASALDYAHRHNIIHRDVKPSNVLLGPDDKAYLSDFGLVLWQKVDKTLGTAFGTPRYISPEQATDSTAVVPQSDVYSLAVMVYEILTGAQLYEGPHPIEVALAHVTQTPTPPRAHNPAIPVAAQTEILKALAKDPNARHKTASEFIQALKAAYSSEAIAPTPVVLTSDLFEDSNPAILGDWDKNPTQPPPPVPIKEVVKQKQEVSIPSPQAVDASMPVVKPDVMPEKPQNWMPYAAGAGALVVVVVILLAAINGGNNPAAPTPTSQAVALTTQEAAPATDEGADAVTDGPTNQPDKAPTDKPTESPSDTPQPEPTLTPTDAEPTAVPLPEGTVNLTLHYNPEAFALVNTSDKTVVIGDLILKSLAGTAEDVFKNDGKLGSTLLPGACLLFKTGSGNVKVPNDWGCSSSTETTLNTPQMFWFANAAADTQFDVLSGEVSAGTCDTVGRAVRRLDATSCMVNWSSLAEG